MTFCPKCSIGRMTGPRYVKSGCVESLRYTCSTCGYEHLTPCADAGGKKPLSNEEIHKNILAGILAATEPREST